MSQAETASGGLTGYDVLMELKRGGMGAVLLARRKGAHGFSRLVAIKTIRADLTAFEKIRTMFQDEARLMAKLHHPAIAQVIDFSEQAGELSLVMEYVAGVSFSRVIDMEPPPAVCCQLMAEVCRGLHAAHELEDDRGNALGVVHRDVSPPNLMVSFDGAVKILDFGIAWVRGRQADETEFGTIKGKPPYMAPEQLKNGPIDRRTDVFSVSSVLHEMLTGERLFDGDSAYAVVHAMEFGEIPTPSSKADRIPGALDEIVMTGLRRDPQERFQTAEAMATALEVVAARLGGESSEAWIKRELAAAKKEHARTISRAVTAFEGEALAASRAIGRASGVMTAVETPANRSLPAVATPESRLAQPQTPTAPVRELESDLTDVAQVASGRRVLVAMVAGMMMLGLAGVGLWQLGGRQESVAPALEASPALAVVDAGAAAHDAASVLAHSHADAGAVAGASHADAGAVASASTADAAVAAVRPRRTATRRRADVGPATVTRPPPPVRDVTPAATFGWVTFGAEPYAIVKLDGQSIGATPIFKRKVPTGSHRVEFIRPDTGAVRGRRTVNVKEGKLEHVSAPD